MKPPDVRSVTFQILESPTVRGEQVRMNIAGEGPFARAIPMRVRVGTQQARVGAFHIVDGSIVAFLMNEPDEGDVVFIGWADDEELPATPFTYARPPIA